ncbi:hypothetical protein A3K73_07840 [Candidatus Pacearchaeota archaeon RBG_13_36_9]|nr:MAG: hypothetical protein A3K73_07840 [Candidatus Pacearchaeota archaeon RBG_13_36_9]
MKVWDGIIAVSASLIDVVLVGKLNKMRNGIHFNKEKSYRTQQELQKSLKNGKKQLGIENLVIDIESWDQPITFCRRVDKNNYQIILCTLYRRAFSLNHELYHIKKMYERESMVLKESSNLFVEAFKYCLEEWNATSYAIKRAQEEGR